MSTWTEPRLYPDKAEYTRSSPGILEVPLKTHLALCHSPHRHGSLDTLGLSLSPILVAFYDMHGLQWDYSLIPVTTREIDIPSILQLGTVFYTEAWYFILRHFPFSKACLGQVVIDNIHANLSEVSHAKCRIWTFYLGIVCYT